LSRVVVRAQPLRSFRTGALAQSANVSMNRLSAGTLNKKEGHHD
jgi:hypothetical protein